MRDATLVCQRSNWKNADIIDTLVAAKAETGDFANAVAYEKQAIGLESDIKNRKILQERLALLATGKPVREDLAIESGSGTKRHAGDVHHARTSLLKLHGCRQYFSPTRAAAAK